MNINEIIKQTNLDEDEKSIIIALNNQLDQHNSVTVRQLAKLTYSSPSKIIRLAKKLGFYGYSDMLFSFRKKMENVVEINLRNSVSSVAIQEDSLGIIDQLIENVLSNEYPQIFIQGLSYSNYVCEYFRDRMNEIGVFVSNMNPLDCSWKSDKYMLILVSNSGETQDIINIAKKCMKDNCIIYALSSSAKSKLCKLVTNSIIVTQKNDLNITQNGSYFTGNAIILTEKIYEILCNFKKMEAK